MPSFLSTVTPSPSSKSSSAVPVEDEAFRSGPFLRGDAQPATVAAKRNSGAGVASVMDEAPRRARQRPESAKVTRQPIPISDIEKYDEVFARTLADAGAVRNGFVDPERVDRMYVDERARYQTLVGRRNQDGGSFDVAAATGVAGVAAAGLALAIGSPIAGVVGTSLLLVAMVAGALPEARELSRRINGRR